MAQHANYELFEEIGRGENSVVYRAWDMLLNRDVAIKEVTAEPGSDGGRADQQRIAEFLKEASFLAQFEHENVLRVHTVDQERGWIVMELMKGSLSNQIRTAPLDADTVRSVLRQMLTALDFLHAKKKVHGSVRPSNILINDQGQAKLSDFEASSLDGELRVPQASKKYLAPELIQPEFGEFGPAVDLYCLGFTALELLTGPKFDSLFPGTDAGAIDPDVAWLRWHSSDDSLKPVNQLAKGIPDDLASVIDLLLSKRVQDRPQSAADVLKLLDDAPLVPVPVIASASPVKRQDPAAILPSQAVKLKEKPTRPVQRPKPTRLPPAATQKDRLNEVLGKPYVLWPICIGMLIGAVLIGLQLQGAREPVADQNPIEPSPIVAPIEPLAITFNVLPDANDLSLSVGGQPSQLGDLKLMPGDHEVLVEKNGFEPYRSTITVSPDQTNFDIQLTEKEVAVAVKQGEPDMTNPEPPESRPDNEPEPKPTWVEVQLSLQPTDATIEIDGQTVELENGNLRLDVNQSDLELTATADGYRPTAAAWSMEELKAADFKISLALDRIPEPKTERPTVALPASLIPKSGSPTDQETGLPMRALVNKLNDIAPLELVLVRAGEYPFGVPDGEVRTWELPGRTVTIEEPFYIGVDEVSRDQYFAFNSENDITDPDGTRSKNFPMTGITVREAAEFCRWAGGRLPTEAEWEAAVRGPDDSGFPLPWSQGNSDSSMEADQCRLFRGESDQQSGLAQTGNAEAGANWLGMINAIGNAAEWCDEQLNADHFLIKGCSYQIPPGDHVRVTWRHSASWEGGPDIGLRLLVPIAPQQFPSAALKFTPPTNLNTVLASTDSADRPQQPVQLETRTVKQIADEFTGPAELVIDSGGFMDEITDIAFKPDGNQIAVGGGKVVRIWDVTQGELVATLRGDRSRTSYGNVNAVTWSPDGKYLLVGVSDYRKHGNIRVYSADDLEEIIDVLPGHPAPCRKLDFSRDGQHLVSVDADGLILVWDWASRSVLHKIPARDRDQPIFDVIRFPGPGHTLIGIDFEGPQVYSTDSGQRLGANDTMPPRVRSWLVDIYNKLVKFPYDVKAEPRVMDFRMEDDRWAGAGNAVVDGRSKFWIRVWESRDPVQSAIPVKELGSYEKHRWAITALSLQPGGPLVASGDKFGEVHVWDSRTGERKFKFAGQGLPIYEVAFDQQSNRLAFGTQPHSPEKWGRNQHGPATRVLDLRQRAIADIASADDFQLINEQPVRGDTEVKVRRQDAYYLVERLLNAQVQASYRISSGRNPTTFTLLDAPVLGVEQPIVFGDNEGLLALWDSRTDELKRAFIGHGGLVSAISASTNGKLIATSSTDRTIRLWSLENPIPTGIFDFKFENSAVREVIPGTSSANAGVRVGDRILSIDGKSLTEMFELMLLGEFEYRPGQQVPVQMSRDGKAFEYTMEMAAGYDFVEPVLNFYVGDDGQWIIWHPQGYYDASPGADRLIGWHLNRGYDRSATFFEVQQFREKLYRPDVIDGILETGSLKAAMSKLESENAEQQEVDFRQPDVIAEYHPPSVRIVSPEDRWHTEADKVTVRGIAESVNGLPLTALTLLHNGAVAKVFRPSQLNQLAMEVSHEVQLQPGANDLVLIAANAKSSSQGKHIVIDRTQSVDQQKINAVVLAIGVSQFNELTTSLPHASQDARAFSQAMQGHENGKLYGKVTVKLLSEQVSDDDVADGFQWLADTVKAGDVAMVYIASQGIVDRRDNFYIATTNSNEDRARSSAVSWRDLMDTLQLDLPDCKRMVFLDLKPTENSIRPGLRNPLLDLAAPEMGTIFLSSNTLQQTPISLASSSSGAFLKAVLETVGDRKFDTQPSSGDALFNPVELAAGVESRVKEFTGGKQQPVFFTPEFARLGNVLELQNQ